MSATKILSLTLVAWGTFGTLAQASPLEGIVWTWTSWGSSGDQIQTSTSQLPTEVTAGSSGPPLPLDPNAWQAGGSTSAPATLSAPATVPVVPAPTPTPAPAPAPITPPPPTVPAPVTSADAFLNFGGGPYPEADFLTTGGAQPWYTSPAVAHVFGGTPTSQQQADFANQVLQDLQRTFKLSGLSPHLTIDPSVPTAHTFSIVSGTGSGQEPNAIGITDVGNNGFGFIDKFDQAQNVGDLAWAIAHNAAHELMHAFGVATHPDATGEYLDAGTATWPLLTDPKATLSPAAVQDILAADGKLDPVQPAVGAEKLVQPVPEPATWAIWTLAATVLGGYRLTALRRRAGHNKAA